MIQSRYQSFVNGEKDFLLWGTFSLLLMFGAVLSLSSTVDLSEKLFNSPVMMAFRQWTAMLLGLLAIWVIRRMPLEIWRTMRWFLFLLGITLLVFVLIPGIGIEVKGSRRWLNLGVFNFQPSEFMKFAFIIFMAVYIEKFAHAIRTEWFNTIKIMLAPMAVVLALLFLEPDAGAMAGIIFIVMGMMFFAGAHILGYLILAVLVGILLVSMLLFESYRLERLLTFSDPWQYYFGSGYQVSHALMAISQGGWLGSGLGTSIQKLGFLPDNHSDFIIAIIIEETGFIGFSLLVLLYAVLIWRLFSMCKAAWKQNELFMGSIPLGLGLWLLFQIMVNMGTALGLLPPKGLTLPFISYGGSNVLVLCLTFGLIARIDYELRRLLHELDR